jgi:hypothetical protein
MNIGSNNKGVASRLSNFTAREFTFDGVLCKSMEGLLQSFKFDKEHIQVEVCKLMGFGAKKRGQGRNKSWKTKQTLWWKGVEYKRKSKEYDKLIRDAYDALATNEHFAKDLLSTQSSTFTHSIGSNKRNDTVLTEREFCGNLHRVRINLQLKEIKQQ